MGNKESQIFQDKNYLTLTVRRKQKGDIESTRGAILEKQQQ